MSFEKVARYFGNLPLSTLLAQPSLRRRVIFTLQQKYYADLAIGVPLGNGLVCPIALSEHWHSFCEIFLAGEYQPVFKHIALPKRWLDLGCHAGYFSLFVAWLLAQANAGSEFACLLIDGDARVEVALEKLRTLNHFEKSMRYKLGVIAKGEGERKFASKSVMSSAIADDNDNAGHLSAQPIITQSDLLKLLPPPYDLIKVDIEGGEYEFLLAYEQVLQQCKYLLLEWHSWHTGGGGANQIKELAKEKGFTLVSEPVAPHPVSENETAGECGVFLFVNNVRA